MIKNSPINPFSISKNRIDYVWAFKLEYLKDHT